MTIFAILMPVPQPKLASEIRSKFPDQHHVINDTQWLVSTKGTVVDLCVALGIYDPKNPDSPTIGNAVIFSTSSYFGRAPTVVWDWLKDALEKPNG